MKTAAPSPAARLAMTPLFVLALGACGSSSGGSGNPPPPGSDGGGPSDSPAPDVVIPHHDAGKDTGKDTSAPPDDSGPPFMNGDLCGAKSGEVAWMGSIAASSATLDLTDVVFGPTSDLVVADQSGSSYEQHRWDETGTFVSLHQDALGAYAGPMTASNVYVDAMNNLFYGTVFTGKVDGTNRDALLTLERVSPGGMTLSTDPHTGSVPASAGAPQILLFDAGGDSGGGLHAAFTMGTPQVFTPGVYCYGSDGSFAGISAPGVTMTMGARDFEWPNASVGMYITKRVTADLDLGCGTLKVPSAGATVLAQVDTGGSCVWNKLLALPAAAVTQNDFQLGADGSLALAVVYTGTIDLGGGAMTSKGKSLAVAHYDGKGNLLFAKTFGGAGTSFTIDGLGVNASGTLMLAGRYAGSVDLGGGALPAGDDTFVATFDSTGALGWARTATVGGKGKLLAAIGACGVAVATNSPSVSFGTGPLSSSSGPAPSIGVATLGL